jgi:hypothetical protein
LASPSAAANPISFGVNNDDGSNSSPLASGVKIISDSAFPPLTFCASPPSGDVNPTVYYVYCIVYLSVWFAILCGAYFLYHFDRQLKLLKTFCSNISEKNSSASSASSNFDMNGSGGLSGGTVGNAGSVHNDLAAVVAEVKSWFTLDSEDMDDKIRGGNSNKRGEEREMTKNKNSNYRRPLIRKVIEEENSEEERVAPLKNISGESIKSGATGGSKPVTDSSAKIVLKEISTTPTVDSASSTSSLPPTLSPQNGHPYHRETSE